MMAKNDDLGTGLYSLVDAARLLKTPRRTLSRWVEGYVQELRGGIKSYASVIGREDASALSFGDLVELMYVRGFREAGVSLGRIRQVGMAFRLEWRTPYPFATKRFTTDGSALLLGEGDDWRRALSGQSQAFFDEFAKQLVHVGDLTSEWRPLGRNHAVVLDPTRAFGQPIDDHSGARTYILARAVEAGDSISRVAWWYGTTDASVEDATRFEHELGAPRQRIGTAA